MSYIGPELRHIHICQSNPYGHTTHTCHGYLMCLLSTKPTTNPPSGPSEILGPAHHRLHHMLCRLQKLDSQGSSLPLLEGWFQSCAEGTSPPSERPASSARQRSWSPLASGSFGARGYSHSPTPNSPNPRLLHGGSGSPVRERSAAFQSQICLQHG